MSLLQAIIIAIVEGITEYLPVSSTGHMIITSSLMGIHKNEFTKVFEVAVQLGAILSVVVLYWRKFFDFKRWQFYVKLIIAVIPALVLGKLFSDKIDAMLESPTTVAITLLLGGFVLLFIDRLFRNSTIDTEEKITGRKAFIIGLWQCLAMIPGMSRSAASIIGGMQQKLSRRLAAEFSFFLAVPTMCAATGYTLFFKDIEIDGVATKGYKMILDSSENLTAFIVGNLTAFVVAMLAIKFFIGFLQRRGFRIFGWYRIIVGIALLILIWTGVIHN
ncbi:undecaprenyl-diphosphate phosphatase [Pseudoflavitalea sp. G-6-1-2]|uniref:undecaprenyl-diphosphate phosphatase n=1 Tax=Pseudoflavitalea sp. G-6-1-2 TaxID=2728841 RepID=UPI00146DCAA3|nr:undecaprenyl-diphosphate phosphatase [Pseudoflavitalea sp. G-6-1-2]NML20528.1 undecaprenyl-diphosphate phosphatase [Pseudoflavitalea sp. G-6-1-2]